MDRSGLTQAEPRQKPQPRTATAGNDNGFSKGLSARPPDTTSSAPDTEDCGDSKYRTISSPPYRTLKSSLPTNPLRLRPSVRHAQSRTALFLPFFPASCVYYDCIYIHSTLPLPKKQKYINAHRSTSHRLHPGLFGNTSLNREYLAQIIGLQ